MDCKPETIKFLEENMRRNRQQNHLCTAKKRKKKEKKINRMKRKLMQWRNIYKLYI